MAAWGKTRNNNLAIWLTLLIDLTATTMIIMKVRKGQNRNQLNPGLLEPSHTYLAASPYTKYRMASYTCAPFTGLYAMEQ